MDRAKRWTSGREGNPNVGDGAYIQRMGNA